VLPGEIEVLDASGRVVVPHRHGKAVVEVLLAAAHAADVESRVVPQRRGASLESLGGALADDQRHGRHHVEVIEGLARFAAALLDVTHELAGVLW